jgi:hypothetical protein
MNPKQDPRRLDPESRWKPRLPHPRPWGKQ